MNVFLKFVADNPLAYPYIGCIFAAFLGFVATLFYGARVKKILTLLKGPVPKLSETAELRAFEEQRKRLRDKADSSGLLAGVGSVISILLMVWLYRSDDSNNYILVSAAILLLASLVQFICAGWRCDTKCLDILESRPELACLKYLDNLPEVGKKSTDGKLFWATLDDYARILEVSKNEAYSRTNAPMESIEAKALSDAQWKASHEERPFEGELVLLVWRDGSSKHKVKTVVTKVTSVEDAAAESLITRPGKAFITAASHKFCGGKVAHYCDTPNEKIERGWLTTADRAHVLLASLRWLNDDQRQYCYQLINPGQSYPPIAQ
jgi:hypothetical protein